MPVTVEFYGIPRRRAGVASIALEAATLGDLLVTLGEQLPEFAETCLDGDRLRIGYIANIDGRTFTTEPSTPLPDGSHVLLLSADVGG